MHSHFTINGCVIIFNSVKYLWTIEDKSWYVFVLHILLCNRYRSLVLVALS